jgi:hypothetical protein
MRVLTYLGNHCTKFEAAGWKCWALTSFYFESCIWPEAILRRIRQRMCIQFFENLGKSVTKTLAMTVQAFGEKAWAVHGESELPETEERRDRRRVKSKACSSFSFTSGVLITKNLSWQAKQSIPLTVVTIYDDCVKMCEDLDSIFGDTRNGCYITTTKISHFFHLETSDQKQHYCRPPPTLFFSL